jgi:uncharacterized membrane protein
MGFIPDWNGLHPLVVHFPVALLLVAPVLVLVGLALERQRAFLFAGLLVMALGTVGAWVAVETGEAAGELAERMPGVEPVLERHGEMAETTRTLFTVLTLVYAGLLFAPLALKRQPRRLADVGAHGLFLAAYAAAAVYLAQTAHQGGILVHQYGVHALQGAAPTLEAGRGSQEDDD